MRVLLVEDEEAISEVLTAILRLENYEVDNTTNGREALEHLATHPHPNVILLDLMMPVMDGWEFLKRKSVIPEIAMIPTVALSAFVETPESLNVWAFVKKPFDTDQLLQLLKKVPPRCNP